MLNSRLASRLTVTVSGLQRQIRFGYIGGKMPVPNQYIPYFTPQQRKVIYGKHRKIVPKFDIIYWDPLRIPGYDSESTVHDLKIQYMNRRVSLTAENVTAMMYMFVRYGAMTQQVFDALEPEIYKNRGEYKPRSIYGGLYAGLYYSRKKVVDFFLNQYKSAEEKFTLNEVLDLLKSLTVQQNSLPAEYKKGIYEQHLRGDLVDGINNIQRFKYESVLSLYESLTILEEQDEQIWNQLISKCNLKNKWHSLQLLPMLYDLSGTYQSAKTLFDELFAKFSTDQEVLSLWNLTEMRRLTPLEIIAYYDEHRTEYHPKQRTIVPEGCDPVDWNEQYERYLTFGAVKKEAEIIKDKSKSLGFAIRDRYESMQDDNIDFSKIDSEQFKNMFGSYEQAIETIKAQDQKIVEKEEAASRVQQEETQGAEKEKKSKGKKKKGEEAPTK